MSNLAAVHAPVLLHVALAFCQGEMSPPQLHRLRRVIRGAGSGGRGGDGTRGGQARRPPGNDRLGSLLLPLSEASIHSNGESDQGVQTSGRISGCQLIFNSIRETVIESIVKRICIPLTFSGDGAKLNGIVRHIPSSLNQGEQSTSRFSPRGNVVKNFFQFISPIQRFPNPWLSP